MDVNKINSMSELLGKIEKPSDIYGTTPSVVTKNTIDSVEKFTIKTKLQQLLDERGMSQADLSRLSGIPKNQISAFVTNKKGKKLVYHHIAALMIALRLTSLDQLLYVEMTEETREQFDKERELWIDTRREPASIQKLMSENQKLA